ncbi:MAG: rhamnopyranosyl-N-acetylglucosaminyl-diphospho-decaprenol beta,3/1,4-galactofuranosyltransferase [Mycobacterium sp.]|jgi:GT2 family glycosyltransferase|nr:rhamnopyranosyl-N-acetylglucosaminyl-diphospho-decaprenol beta,3/1,4-galactofuranosyltransferase [Mycobacterium sp.]
MTATPTSVAAVVVSFNRGDRLVRAIEGLQTQTRLVDEIIVVENGSTDGSREYLRGLGAAVLIVESHRNVGGAGGFALGLAWALHRGHDLAWLMDDDAKPHADCLDQLLQPFGGDVGRYSFTSPHVVDANGRTGPRNHQLLSSSYEELFRAAEQGYLAASSSSFVGPLISLHHARRTHLPLADFFIWHDDGEYTGRLAALAPAIAVPTARIAHLPDGAGPRVYDRSRATGNFRNLIWWYREDTSSAIPRRTIIRWFVSISVSNARTAGLRGFLPLLASFTRGTFQAVTRRPAHQSAEDVVRASQLDDVVVEPDAR